MGVPDAVERHRLRRAGLARGELAMTIANSLERIATALEAIALTSGVQGLKPFLLEENPRNVTTNTVAGLGASNFGSPARVAVGGGVGMVSEGEAVEYGVLYKDVDAVRGGAATHTADGAADAGTHAVSIGGGSPANEGRGVVSTGAEYPATRRSWWPTVLAIADIAAESAGMMDGREWLAGMDPHVIRTLLLESGIPLPVAEHHARTRERAVMVKAKAIAAYAELGTIDGVARRTGLTPVKARRTLVAAGVLGESAA